MFGHLSEGISCVHSFILHAEDTIAFHLLTDVTTENKEQKSGGLRGPAKGTAASSSLFSRSGKLHPELTKFRQGANDTVLFPAVENPPAHQHFVTGAGKRKGGRGREKVRGAPFPLGNLFLLFSEAESCVYRRMTHSGDLKRFQLLRATTWGAPGAAPLPRGRERQGKTRRADE